MWVADMDFRCPKPVIDRVLEKAAFGVYAYTATPPAFRAATAGWQSRRHHWDIGEAMVIPISSVVPALYTAVAAFTEPGDRVILQRPGAPGSGSQGQADAAVQPAQPGGQGVYPAGAGENRRNLPPQSGAPLCR